MYIRDLRDLALWGRPISDKYLEITKCGIVRENAESPTVSGSVHLPNLSSLGDRPEIWPENPSVGGGWAAEPSRRVCLGLESRLVLSSYQVLNLTLW